MRWRFFSVALSLLAFIASASASDASAPSEVCGFADTSSQDPLHQSLNRLLEIANDLAEKGDRTAAHHLTKADISEGGLSGEQAAARDLRRIVRVLKKD